MPLKFCPNFILTFGKIQTYLFYVDRAQPCQGLPVLRRKIIGGRLHWRNFNFIMDIYYILYYMYYLFILLYIFIFIYIIMPPPPRLHKPNATIIKKNVIRKMISKFEKSFTLVCRAR